MNHVTTVRFEDNVWELLKQASVAENRSISTIVRRAVQKHFGVPYTEGNRPGKRDRRSTRTDP